MVKRLGIFTAGGLARAVASHFGQDYEVVCFVDTPRKPDEKIFNIPVMKFAPREYLAKYIIACGDPKRKKKLVKNLVEWRTLIHKTATVSKYATIGEGSVICPGVVIDPDVRIGRHVYIDHNAVIGHGAEIGNFTTIGPLVLVAGYCEIEYGAYIGTGAKIVKNASIGHDSIIGAGAVVLNDVPPNEVWAGVPAKKIGDNNE